jgi:hypothetical protein
VQKNPSWRVGQPNAFSTRDSKQSRNRVGKPHAYPFYPFHRDWPGEQGQSHVLILLSSMGALDAPTQRKEKLGRRVDPGSSPGRRWRKTQNSQNPVFAFEHRALLAGAVNNSI